MKKLGLVFKKTLEKRIKDYSKGCGGIFVINYSKLSSPDMTSLRRSLKGSQATLFIAKNSVARRALKDSGMELLSGLVQGHCSLIFIKDEPVEASKVLCEFLKSHEQFKIEGGVVWDKMMEAADIQALAKLPSKHVLLTQVVIGLKSPITGLVMALKGNLNKLVYCLEQIKNKKGN
ncbi:MAG: 50S ribosomal protein L10 [Candidatus Omnitrophica bacterium]|nr:50S ribosomal protein L10 [Candidatus Omnitrophota bacterium]